MPRIAFHRAAAFAAVLAAAGPAAGEPRACHAESGPQTAALVELYTSEGCDSCPPADRWLSATFAPDAARTDAVALAFHVDYWDRLGWKDRFATADWTRRQEDAAQAANTDLVYTPQVLVQGRDFRGWSDPSRFAAGIAAARRPARASLTLDAAPQPGAVAVTAAVRIPAEADRAGARVFVALTGNGLVSEVKSGENAGKRLTHDHVVRVLRDAIAIGREGEGAGTVALPLPAEAGQTAAVVAFVQNVATGDVLQALALPLAPACLPDR